MLNRPPRKREPFVFDQVLKGLRDNDPMYQAYLDVLASVPDNVAKVDGEWHHIPDEHFIEVESVPTPYGADTVAHRLLDWRMEHSLPCRVRGMKDCEVQEVWELHLEEDGYWPANGRYRIWVDGDFIGEGEDQEDTRTIGWEKIEPDG